MNKTISIILICGVILGFPCPSQAVAEDSRAEPAGEKVRVGTFDSRLVTTAYVRSELFQRRLAKMQSELQAAKSAGDEQRVKQLEAAGPALQHLIHKQGFGTWPIHDILQTIKAQLPQIAKQADVDLIISKWDIAYRRQGMQAVDVTSLMVAPFHPTEQTREVLETLSKQKPVPLGQLEKH